LKALFFILLLATAPVHKFYLSLTEIKYNTENGHLEIASKIFIDDLESAVEGLNVADQTDEKTSDLIGNYLLNKTAISINKNTVDLNYLGFEIDDDVVWCYLESDKVKKPKSVRLEFNMLLDEIETQTNVIHFDLNKDIQTLFLKDDQRVGVLGFE